MAKRTTTIVVEKFYCDLHTHLGDPDQEAQTQDYELTVDGRKFESDLCDDCKATLEAIKAYAKLNGVPVEPSTSEQAIKAASVVPPVPTPPPAAAPSEPEAKEGRSREAAEPVEVDAAPREVICQLCLVAQAFDRDALDAHTSDKHGKDWRTLQWLVRDDEGQLVSMSRTKLVDLLESANKPVPTPPSKPVPKPAPPKPVPTPPSKPVPPAGEQPDLRELPTEVVFGWEGDPDAVQCVTCGSRVKSTSKYMHANRSHDTQSTKLPWVPAHPWEMRRKWECQVRGCGAVVPGMHLRVHAVEHGVKVDWKPVDPPSEEAKPEPKAKPEPEPELVNVGGGQKLPKGALDSKQLLDQELVLCKEPECAGKKPFKAASRANHAGSVHNKKQEEITFVLASDPKTHYMGHDEFLSIVMLAENMAASEKEAKAILHRDRNQIKRATVRCPYSSCNNEVIGYTQRGAHAWDRHGVSSVTSVPWEPVDGWPDDPPRCKKCNEPFPTVSKLLAHVRHYDEHPNDPHKPYGVGDVVITQKFDPDTGVELPKHYQEEMTMVQPGTVTRLERSEIARREGADRLPIVAGELNAKGEPAF